MFDEEENAINKSILIPELTVDNLKLSLRLLFEELTYRFQKIFSFIM